MPLFQYSLVAVLLVMAAVLATYFVILLVTRKSHGAADGSGSLKVGYSQWLDSDATDKYPQRGKCLLYDFGTGHATLETSRLDMMASRPYADYETCTDSNQTFAAKVKRECHLYVDGSKSLVNHCHSQGEKKPQNVGHVDYVYSSVFCERKDAKKNCRGFIAFLKMGGKLFLAPNIVVDKKSKEILPLADTEAQSVPKRENIFHVTRYTSQGKPGEGGKYLVIVHQASGTVLSPGNSNSGAMWRLVRNAPFFHNQHHVLDQRLIYLGTPSSADWKKFPASDQEFAEYAHKRQLSVAHVDLKHPVLRLNVINKYDDDLYRLKVDVISYSPP